MWKDNYRWLLDYDQYLPIKEAFESKNGKYYKYVKFVSKNFLYFFYDNFLGEKGDKIILIESLDYKNNWNDMEFMLSYIRSNDYYEKNIILICSEWNIFFSKNKYLLMFYKICEIYWNDIVKNWKLLINIIYKIYKIYFNYLIRKSELWKKN